MATVLSISIRSLGGQRDTEADVIEAARSKDVTRSRNTSATTANAKGKQPQPQLELELEHRAPSPQSQQTRLLPLRSAATSSESLGHSLGSTAKRPPSASLLLLEALHGATVAAGADLKDSHFVIEKNGVPVYTSTVARATLNPTWNIDATAFPTLTQNRRDLVLHIWTRSASRSTINNHFCQYRSINFNASLLNFIGRDLLELEKTHLSSELILVQLEDGIYRLDDDSSKPATDEQTSLDEDEIKDSYTRNAFVTLENLSSELTLLQEALGNLLKESEQKIPIKAVIADPNIAFRDCLFRKTSCLTQQIKSKSKVVEMERDKLDSLRKDIQRRKNRLFYSSKDREQCQQTLLSTINDLNDYGIIIHETFKYKTVSGRSFIAGIKEIYPINTLREDPNAYFIRRIWLPHSEFSSVDEDRTSTALGWTAHLVTLLALYLELPLRYPINPMSSRSMILDRISQHPAASMEFPLFMKGSDKQRFEYGVFLLNKNIEQLLNHLGLSTKNLRNTLPNLKLVIEAIAKADINGANRLTRPSERVIDPPNIEEPEVHLSLSSLNQQNSRDVMFTVNQNHRPLSGEYTESDVPMSDEYNQSENTKLLLPSPQNNLESIPTFKSSKVVESQFAEQSQVEFEITPLPLFQVSPTSVSLLESALDSATLQQQNDNVSRDSVSESAPSETPRRSSTPRLHQTFPESLPTQALSFTSVNAKLSTGVSLSSSFGPESNSDFTSSVPIRILASKHNSSTTSTLPKSLPTSLSLARSIGSKNSDSSTNTSPTSKKSLLERMPPNEETLTASNAGDDNDSSDSSDEDEEVMGGVLREMTIDIPRRGDPLPFPTHLSPSGNSLISPSSVSSNSSSGTFRTPTSGVSLRSSFDNSDTVVNGHDLERGGSSVTTRPSMLGLGWTGLQQPLSIAGSMFFNPFNLRPSTDVVVSETGETGEIDQSH